jgi:hypothetical protein
MSRAQILYRNLVDPGTVTASSWVASAPPSILQDFHVSRRWEGRNGDTESITFDLGSAQSVDTVCLFGCQGIFASGDQSNLTSAAVRRVRLSASDPTGEAGELYDSDDNDAGVGFIKEAYGAMVELLDTPVVARYGIIDLSEGGTDTLLAGRLVVGLRSPFTINFGYGWARGYADLSRKKKSAGGQTFIDRDDRYRVLNLTFETLEQADRDGFVDEIDRLNGVSSDVLFVIDPDSTDITRDTIWGLINDMSPPTQPNLAFFSKSYNIEERR